MVNLTSLLLLLLAFSGSSQTTEDSLWMVWNNQEESDSNRFNAYNKIIENYYMGTSPDSCKTLLENGIKQAKQIPDKRHLSDLYSGYCAHHYYQGALDSSIRYANLSIQLSKKIDYKDGISNGLNTLAILYKVQGKIPQALQAYQDALEIRQKEGMNIDYILGNMGSLYQAIGNYEKALDYTNKSLKLREEAQDSAGMSYSYSLLAKIYIDQNEYQKSLEYYKLAFDIDNSTQVPKKMDALGNIGIAYSYLEFYDKAIEYHKKCLEIENSNNFPIALSTVYNNIGGAFYKQQELDSAIHYFKLSLEIPSTNYEKLAIGQSNISEAYFEQKNYDESLTYAKRSLINAQKSNSKTTISSAAKSLWKCYKAIGKNKEALEAHEYYISMKDSVESENNQRVVIQNEYKYQYEKKAAIDSIAFAKEQQISDAKLAEQEAKAKAESDRQEAEIKQKRTQQYALFGGLALLLVFLGFVYNRFRVTKKQKDIIADQKVEVEAQKQEAETQRDIADNQRLVAEHQKEIVEEKNKEIMDSITYAKRLQEAILPPPRLVKEWLTDSFLFYKPKDIVAGDFYWMETVDTEIDGRKKTLIFFAAADCTGHGVPGAMVSVVCANALNRSVKEFQLKDPGQVLDKVTELVIQSFEQSEEDIKDGMDIALCALDMSSKKLYFSGANNPLWIVTEKAKDSDNKYINEAGTHELIEYKATKQPVGKYEGNKQFVTEEIQLKPGDAMYIFSDGFADQFGGVKGKKYKYANFKRFLLANYSAHMDEQKARLATEFDQWKRDLEQIDDVCIIGVKINGKERNNFTKRELEVLEHLRDGLSSKLIAEQMNISSHTVDTYRRRLLAKTGTYNATELIKYCNEKEII